MAVKKILNFPFQRKVPRPPPKLAQAGRRLWREIQEDYGISDPGGLSHLMSACRAEDDIRRMRMVVARDGDAVVDRFGQKKPHPLLTAIHNLEAVKRLALVALNLDVEPLRDRPGRPGGR